MQQGGRYCSPCVSGASTNLNNGVCCHFYCYLRQVINALGLNVATECTLVMYKCSCTQMKRLLNSTSYLYDLYVYHPENTRRIYRSGLLCALAGHKYLLPCSAGREVVQGLPNRFYCPT